jgi:hypothetical protein
VFSKGNLTALRRRNPSLGYIHKHCPMTAAELEQAPKTLIAKYHAQQERREALDREARLT